MKPSRVQRVRRVEARNSNHAVRAAYWSRHALRYRVRLCEMCGGHRCTASSATACATSSTDDQVWVLGQSFMGDGIRGGWKNGA